MEESKVNEYLCYYDQFFIQIFKEQSLYRGLTKTYEIQEINSGNSYLERSFKFLKETQTIIFSVFFLCMQAFLSPAKKIYIM